MIFNSIAGFASFGELYVTDPYFSCIWIEVQNGLHRDFMLQDGFMFKGNQLCIPDCCMCLRILNEWHAEGHVGRYRTLQLIIEQYFWPTLSRDMERYVD